MVTNSWITSLRRLTVGGACLALVASGTAPPSVAAFGDADGYGSLKTAGVTPNGALLDLVPVPVPPPPPTTTTTTTTLPSPSSTTTTTTRRPRR